MNMNHITGLRYGFRKRVLINIHCANDVGFVFPKYIRPY